MTSVRITAKINGETHEIDVKPHWNLLHVLRETIGLTGPKCGCGTGDCGACNVILNGKLVRSCLKLAAQCDGSEIITIEGIGVGPNLTLLQEAFVKHGAFQCGYCTPGMILAAQALLGEKPKPTIQDIREALTGNLCRCTNYQKIIEAIMDVTS